MQYNPLLFMASGARQPAGDRVSCCRTLGIIGETVTTADTGEGSLEGEWRREKESGKVARQDRFKSGKLTKKRFYPFDINEYA